MAAKAAADWNPLLQSDDVPISPMRLVGEMMRALDPARTVITHDSGYPRDHLAPHYVCTLPADTWVGQQHAARVVSRPRPGRHDGGAGQDLRLLPGRRRLRAVRARAGDGGPQQDPGAVHPDQQLRDDWLRRPSAHCGGALRSQALSGSYTEIGLALGASAYRISDPNEVATAIRKGIAEVEAGGVVLLEFITSATRHRISSADVFG